MITFVLSCLRSDRALPLVVYSGAAGVIRVQRVCELNKKPILHHAERAVASNTAWDFPFFEIRRGRLWIPRLWKHMIPVALHRVRETVHTLARSRTFAIQLYDPPELACLVSGDTPRAVKELQ